MLKRRVWAAWLVSVAVVASVALGGAPTQGAAPRAGLTGWSPGAAVASWLARNYLLSLGVGAASPLQPPTSTGGAVRVPGGVRQTNAPVLGAFGTGPAGSINLEIRAIEFMPPILGLPFQPNVQVANVGTADVTRSSVTLSAHPGLRNNAVVNVNTGPLTAGQTKTFTVNDPALVVDNPGDYDLNGSIFSLDTDLNGGYFRGCSVMFTPIGPDLTVTNVVASTTALITNTKFDVTATINNVGQAGISSFDVQLFKSGPPTLASPDDGHQTVAALPANSSTTVTFKDVQFPDPVRGTLYVWANRGMLGGKELDDSNNIGSLPVVVTQYLGLADSAWPKFHQNAQNTGVGKGPVSAGRVTWSAPFHRQWSSAAVGAGGRVFAAVDNGLGGSTVKAFDSPSPANGAPTTRWSYALNGYAYASPAIGADGTVYIGDTQGKVYALRDNGSGGATLVWLYTGGASCAACAPTLGPDGTVYIADMQGKVYALKGNGADTPTLVWSYDTRGQGGMPSPAHGSGYDFVSSPALGADGTVYVGSASGTIYALKANGTDTPTVVWSYAAGAKVGSSPAVGADGTVYVGSEVNNKVFALKGNGTTTPTVVWSYNAGGRVNSSPAVTADGTVYIGSGDRKVYALKGNGTTTPEVVWSYTTGGAVDSSPAVASDGTVYVGSADDKVYALKGNGTATPEVVWSYTTTGEVGASPAIGSDGTVYVPSNGTLYALGQGYLNLRLASLTCNTPVFLDTPFTATAQVVNDGTLPCSNAMITLDSYPDFPVGTLVSAQFSGPLAPGESKAVVFSDRGMEYLEGGAHTLTASCLSLDVVPDGNPDDHLATAEVTPLGPDLVVTNIVPPDIALHTNTTFNVTATIKNIGTAGVRQSFYVDLTKHSDTEPDYSAADSEIRIESLAAGASTVVTFPNVSYPTAGSYKLWVVANPGQGRGHELNATNNARSLPLTVTEYLGLADSAWPKFRQNSLNTGVGVGQGSLGRLDWSYATGDQVRSSPALGPDGTVYIGSNDGKVYALRGTPGAEPTVVWSYQTGGAVRSTPTVGADGTIYVGSLDGKLYALKDNGSATPTVVWSYTTGGEVWTSPALGPDGTVYFGSTDKKVYALRSNGSATPTVVWSYATGDAVYSSPALGPDGTVYIGSNDGNVRALRGNGSTLPTVVWTYYIPGNYTVNPSPAVGPDGTVYVGAGNGTIYALKGNSTNTPTLVWSYKSAESIVSSPAVGADGTVYVGSVNNSLYALKANGTSTPTVVWRYETGDDVRSSPAIGADGTVYVGSSDRTVYALRANGTGTPTVVWRYKTGGAVRGGLAIGADGTVYCGSDDRQVYALGRGYSDLSLSNVMVSSSQALAGWPFDVSGTVANAGTGATGPFRIGLYRDRATAPVAGDTPDDYVVIDNLEPGQTVGWNITGLRLQVEGDHKLWLLADSAGVVREKDETNNGATAAITVLGRDLKVTGVLPTTAAPAVGAPFTVAASIKNLGQDARSAAGPFVVGLYKDRATAPSQGDTPDDTQTVMALAPGASTTVTFSGLSYASAGTKTLWVLADMDANVTEADETNNAQSLVLGVGANDGLANSGWPRFHQNVQNTGVAGEQGSLGRLNWSYTTGGAVHSSPVIGADGTIYVGSQDGKVYALKGNGTTTPTVVWSFATGDGVQAPPTVGADGTVYVGSTNGKVYALKGNATSKPTVVWSYTTGAAVRGAPAVARDGTVYVGSADYKVYALRGNGGATPTVVWTYTAYDEFASSPALGPDGTVYVGSADGVVYALQGNGSATPTRVWRFNSGSAVSSPAVGADGTVYFGSNDGRVWAVRGNGGSPPPLVWQYRTGDDVLSSPAVGPDGTVYVGSNDGKVYALRGAAGATPTVLWSYATGGPVESSPAVGADGTVYVGSNHGQVLALRYDGSSGATLVWSYTTGGEVRSSPAIGADGTIYVGSGDSKLYALGQGNPDLTVTSVTPSTTSPTVTLPFTVTALVRNQGQGDIAGPFTVGLYKSRATAPTTRVAPDATQTVNGLAAGATATVTFSGVSYAAGGPCKLWILADSGAAVPEADESNDVASVDLNVLAPDLLVTQLNASTSGPTVGAHFSVTASVKNVGQVDVSGPFGVGLTKSKTLAPRPGDPMSATQTVNGLAAGASTTVTFTELSYSAAGTYKLWVLADCQGVVAEVEEANNTGSLTLQAGANAGLANSAWPRFRQNLSNTGLGVGQGSPGRLTWSYTTRGNVSSSPVIGPDGTIYVGSRDNNLYALRGTGAATPTLAWSFGAGGAVSNATVGADGTVYVGSGDGKVYALKGNATATPTLVWSYKTGGEVLSAPAIAPDGTVYVGSGDGKLYALKGNTGSTPTLVWSYTAGGAVTSAPALGVDGTVYFGCEDGKVYAVKGNGTATPTLVWSYTTAQLVRSSPALGADGTVYIGSYDGKVYALKGNGSATPTVVWTFTAGTFVHSSPALGADGTVYIGSDDFKLYALLGNGSATPTVVWSYATTNAVTSSPAVAPDGTVYVGSQDRSIYALKGNGTSTPALVWSYRTGGVVTSSPAIGPDGTVYVGANDRKVYALGQGYRDLVVTAVTPPTSPLSPGAPFSVQATVKNQGTTDITTSFLVGLYKNRASAPDTTVVPDKTATVASLAAGASTTVTFDGVTYPAFGSYPLWVMADRSGSVKEADETNNTATTTINIVGPDLVVTSLTSSTSQPPVGTSYTVTATVKNQGTRDIATPFAVGLYKNRATAPTTADRPDVTQTLSSLAAGASATVTFSALPATVAGDSQLWVLADSSEQWSELVETNNTASVTITAIQPDLVVTQVQPSAQPALGGSCDVAVTVKNQGSQAVTGAFLVGLYNNRATAPTTADTPNATQTVSGLAVGGSTTVTFTNIATASLGTPQLWALVDSGNTVSEQSEANNALDASWTTGYARLPYNQTTPQDTPLVFNTTNANAVSLSLPNAGGSTLALTLAATNGTLTLGGSTGVTVQGSGTPYLNASGTQASLNAALNGLTFTPRSRYCGLATVQFSVMDTVSKLGSTNTVRIWVSSAGYGVVAWGYTGRNACAVPAGLANAVQVAAGGNYWSLALKADQTVVGWGNNDNGQINVSGLRGVLSLSAGILHNLALSNGGTVSQWGDTANGQGAVPAGLADVVGMAAGGYHNLAVKGDGTVVAWGSSSQKQTTVPTGLSGVIAVAGGWNHSLALKNDGTVVAWGSNSKGERDVPAGLRNVVAIAAGAYTSAALKSDGSVAFWGDTTYGVQNVAAGLWALALGEHHGLGLKSDQSVVGWGTNTNGQIAVPASIGTKAFGVAAGRIHSLALVSLTPRNAVTTLGVSLTTTPVSPQLVGTSVTLVAQATGATNVEYQFWVSADGGKTRTLVQDWSTDNTAEWLPGASGTYLIGANARSGATSATASQTFLVTAS